MGGLVSGVASRLQSQALYICCYRQALNLACPDTIKSDTVTNALQNLQINLKALQNAIFQDIK